MDHGVAGAQAQLWVSWDVMDCLMPRDTAGIPRAQPETSRVTSRDPQQHRLIKHGHRQVHFGFRGY